MPIVSLQYSRKFNLGNYESEEISVAYELDSDEDADAALARMKAWVNQRKSNGGTNQ